MIEPPDDRKIRPVAMPSRITLPSIPRASAEEIERRRTLFAQAMALRGEIGPIGVSAAELIRWVRDEADGV